jgi:hypothetical protein
MHTPLNIISAEVKPIIGDRLSRNLRYLSKDWRAVLAHETATGAAQLYFPTRKQAAALFGVSLRYVTAVAGLTPEQRELVKRRRLTLSSVVNRKPPIDGIIDKLIIKHGADAFLRGIDRVTQPPANGGSAS